MKGKSMGIIQLIISIVILALFHFFYWRMLALVGLRNLSGLPYMIANFGKYLLITMLIFAIYYRNIRSGQHKFSKTFLNSFIYCVACFVFLLIITIILHNLLNYIGNPRGISIGYNFTNYFNQKFTLSFALDFIVECLFMPFLLCVIFPLGFSNIFYKYSTASFASGITYGILYAISLNSSFEYAIFHALTPACLIILLTYLYKTNQNIWSVIITYAMYVLFGVYAINYIL